MNGLLDIIQGDALEKLRELPGESVQCCVTSPPYWGLRDYGVVGQIGLEETPGEYVAKLGEVFREVWRVLRNDGTLWLNLGDSYNNVGVVGLKPKDLIGIPWRAAFALQADGLVSAQRYYSRSRIRCRKTLRIANEGAEYLFLLAKAESLLTTPRRSEKHVAKRVTGLWRPGRKNIALGYVNGRLQMDERRQAEWPQQAACGPPLPFYP
jgi:hypothetical protein